MAKRGIITVTTAIPTVEEMAREYGMSSTQLKHVQEGVRVALMEVGPGKFKPVLVGRPRQVKVTRMRPRATSKKK